MSPSRALPRPAALRDLLLEVTTAAVGLLLFLLILAFLLGEGSLAITASDGVTRVMVDWHRPFWGSRLATIFAWDLVLFFVAIRGLRFCPPAPAAGKSGEPIATTGIEARRPHHKEELLLAIVLSLILWRVVAGSLLAISIPGNWSAAGAPLPGIGETLLILGALMAGKLRLARRLEEADHRLDSPLLAVCCWHHRKDAIFNGLFLVTLAAAWKGYDPGRLEQMLHFVKIALLGGASLGIVTRAARALTAAGSARREEIGGASRC